MNRFQRSPNFWRLPHLFLCVAVTLTFSNAQAAELPSQPQFKMELREMSIVMPDGVKLAADVFMPTDSSQNQAIQNFPVLLEYLPYRKTDSRDRDWKMYAYFVERGYAVARVDIRGTGNSQGKLVESEYSEQELEDGKSVIHWLASQAWSNGNVAMFGISWSGFNALQMTMKNVPELKTIIAVDATEDLYQDDVHFMDGIMHVDSWEMSQDLDNSRPGAPDYMIDEAYFHDRFDTPPWMMATKAQQRDGPYWDRASLKGKYDLVKIPVFLIGGWYDGYRNSILRLFQNIHAPVKAIVGPWSHSWPHDAFPKPGMEWRYEAVRWFDYWLKGKDTGIMDEPRLAVFMRQWHPPGPVLEEVPGTWRWENSWPVKGSSEKVLYPQSNHTLSDAPSSAHTDQLRYAPGTGIEAGGPVMWWGDVAYDQRATDAYSLVYDSAAVEQPLEILGLPMALLNVSADTTHANWIVRLSDVAPDGRVTLITGAAFNGSHRNSAIKPAAISPNKFFPLKIKLHFTSWVFAPGHRIRFSVNNAQWPMLWPTPLKMTTQLQFGGKSDTHFILPVVPKSKTKGPTFLAPTENAGLAGFETTDEGSTSGFGEISEVNRNLQTGEITVLVTNQSGQKYPWGTEHYQEKIEHRVNDNHPESASVDSTNRFQVDVSGRILVWESITNFHSDQDNFYYNCRRTLTENGVLIREKQWTKTIPRDFQ